jgi:solute carrier family 45 protein 1/2/4
LAWVASITRALVAVFGFHSHESIKSAVQVGTIICITLLNLSIQPLQSGLRALIVDVCPSDQQAFASAWAGRFTGISNILGYILGSLPLSFVSQDNEAWRFRFLSMLAVVVLAFTVLVTIYFIQEEDPREQAYEPYEGIRILQALRNVKNGWSSMPLQARRVCFVQFFAWMGWFGFLFYSTSYVSRLYINESRRRGVEHFSLLRDAGTRLGTFASLLSAITALTTTMIVPYITSINSVSTLTRNALLKGLRTRVGSGLWRETHIIWATSLLLYAVCTFSTIFISSTNAAILIIALTGVPWGITQWAPFALLGKEIAMHQAQSVSTAEKGGRQWMTSQSGTIMGVHNAAISVPQILAALGSSAIFHLLEGNRFVEDDGIAWVLRTSGMAALVAAYFAWRLK